MKRNIGPVLISRNLFNNKLLEADLLKRFNLYGSYVQQYSKNTYPGITLISNILPEMFYKKSSQFEHLKLIKAPSSKLNYLFFLRNFLKNNKNNISIIISGDPWFDLVLIKIASYKLGIKIQVSIHGEPYLKVNILGNFSNFLKHIWLIYILNQVDSVRLVSSHQVKFVKKAYNVQASKILVAPIPVLIPTFVSVKKKTNTLLFLGRLHPERGLKLWLEIVIALHEKRQDFSLLIIGDGPSREFLQGELEKSKYQIKYNFIGWIEQKDISKYFSKAKVLLNSAQTESFGISMREAQLHGVPIVSIRNNGAIENLKIFKTGIYIYDETFQAVSLLNECFNDNLQQTSLKNSHRIQRSQNHKYLLKIAESWVN
jgi:glycosyltransferase involved in cell wall biosynthesis